jgi:hypothetical protein
MKPYRYLFERGHRLGLVLILMGVIAASGCDSGGNVLTPPEGGSNVGKEEPKPVKLKPGTTSRREREKENAG